MRTTPPATAAASRSLTTATSACPPPTDTQAPSVPQGMAFSGTTTQTTVALAWNASTDNVGVAGYRLFRNDVSVATVATPGYTYTGLTCGTSYTLAIEAYDAAGNVLQPLDGGRHDLDERLRRTRRRPASAPGSRPTSGWTRTAAPAHARRTPGAWVDNQACSWNAGLPGRPDRRPDPGPRRELRQRDHRPEQGLDRGARRHLPHRERRERRLAKRRDTGTSPAPRAAATSPSSVDGTGAPSAPTRSSNIVVDGWNVDCNGCDNEQIFHLEAANNVTWPQLGDPGQQEQHVLLTRWSCSGLNN